MGIDHIGIAVPAAQHADIVAWYLAALAPLGYEKIMEVGPNKEHVGIGANKMPDWWIAVARPGQEVIKGMHIAFKADDHETVDKFHAAATAAGGKCNGPPGLRPDYHPYYYGAFVLDQLGNNVEVVCHNAPKS